MNVYQLAVLPLGSVWILLFILAMSAVIHGWAFTQAWQYARVLGRSPIWWGVAVALLGSAIGLWFRTTLIFTDRIPPLRVVDFVEYSSQLALVLAVLLYLKSKRLQVTLTPHRRRHSDHT